MEVEHSRLLKFFTQARVGTKMAETPIIKIQKDYQNPPNVEAEVPGAHKIRELDAENGQDSAANNSSEIEITEAEFTLSPVITVTKKESTLTKGDMKLQKVSVTEDIAKTVVKGVLNKYPLVLEHTIRPDKVGTTEERKLLLVFAQQKVMEDTENGEHRLTGEEGSLRRTARQTSNRTEVINQRSTEKRVSEGEMDKEEKGQDDKKSRIPIMRLRHAAEKVKKEREAQKARKQPRRSSIPKLKDPNKAVKRDTSLKFEPKLEDEFDKIYEEIVDNKQKDIDDKLLALPMEDTEIVESKFEEIIQSYDEDEQEKHTVSRVSKIPALRKRRDDRPSKLGSLVDTVRDKTPATESKLKDGGFKVTASTIKTKRFSRGNSTDLSREEQRVEVTEAIDIKDSGDSEVFVRETSNKAPAKPKRSIRSVSKQITNEGRKIDIIETMQSSEQGYSEKITTVKESVKDVPVKSKRTTRVISRELKSDDQDIDINKKIEELKNTPGVETVNVQEFEDGRRIITKRTVRENIEVTPVKTKRIIRGVSREMNKDINVTENEDTTYGGHTETMTVEEFNDGDGRTVTTTTTVRESVTIGTPVITETIIHNISREMSTESQTLHTKEIDDVNTVTIEEITDDKNEIKEQEDIKGDSKPLKTESFTRGISREMGNIRHRDNKKNVTEKKVNDDDSETVIKNTISKENITVGTPPTLSRENLTIETINESVPSPTVVDTEENPIKPDENKGIIKKETMETEQIVKESIKIGIPVFTKVTQSFSKGKIQNVEISKTIEWKPADDLRTKNYSRSVSEKVTKKEIRDAKDWKFSRSTNETTDPKTTDIDKPKAQDDITVSKNDTSKDPGLERRIKDTVKDIATKIADKKVIEYKSEKQITNTEKTKYTLSKSVDLTIDRDSEESRQLDKQTSLIDPKRAEETNIEQVKTEYLREINNNDDSDTVIVNKKSETEYIDLSKEMKDDEAVTILRGNVNRLKDKITKENAVVSKKETVGTIPKEKSVLSKIAMFERLEPSEPVFKKLSIKGKYIPKKHIDQKPKIVNEILKEQPKDDFGETNKVEIGDNYDEVTYINEPVINKEYWKTEEGSGINVSTINRVLTEKTTTLQTQESINKENLNAEAKILPEIIDFTSDESQIEFANAIPAQTTIKGNECEVVTPLPEKLDFDPHQFTESTENIVQENKIKTNDSEFDYEIDIGKTRPGKINLNIWKTQVEVNKTLVDKKDVIRGESLEEIAKILPGNVDIKTYESHVQVSKVLPENIEFKKDDTKFQYTKPLPAKIAPDIKEIPFDIVRILPEKIDDFSNVEEMGSTSNNKVEIGKAESEKIYEIPVEIPKPLPVKIDFTAKEFELPKILPDKKEYLRPQSYIECIGANQNKTEAIKPAPGKLNLGLWKNQVEANKISIGKNNTNKNKDIEVEKEHPGRTDLKTYDKQVNTSKTVQGKLDLNSADNKDEIVKSEVANSGEVAISSPAEIAFSTIDNEYSTESQAETVEVVPVSIEFSSSDDQFEASPRKLEGYEENQNENPANVTKIINFENNVQCIETQVETIKHTQHSLDTIENKSEVTSSLPEKIDFKPTENKVEVLKPSPGRLDLKAWEHKVKINKSLVEKIHTVKSDNINETSKTLPGNNNISVYENKMQIPTILLAKNYSKNLEIPSADTETYSDPELYDDQESNVSNNNKIIRNINSKTYFVTKENNVQNSADKAMENKISEGEFAEANDYEKKVEELHTKTYTISDIGNQTIIENKMIKKTVTTVNASDNIYETNIVENHKVAETEENITTNEYEINPDINTVQNNTTFEVISNSINNNETIESEFNFDASKIQHEISLSAYGAEDFKMPKEDVKRAKSLAELDLGDVINGTVRRIVGRMKSLDFERRDSVKSEKISLKEMPKKMSVLEKIALFEGKTSSTKTEFTATRTKVTKRHDTPNIPEEVYLHKIEELTNAKTKYGRMEEMLYLHLANDVEMPVISLGTALLDKRLLPHLIGAAIDLGYRAIDTAYIYGNEEEIGQAIKAKIDDGTVKREDLFITSKLWSTFHRPDLVEEACRASLKNLGLDYFDLYLIHNPMSFKEGPDPLPKIATVLQYSEYDYLDAWFGMEGLVAKGLVKSIGVSNFNSQQIQRILDKGKLKPMVNQVECHPYLSQQRLSAFCNERNITLSCFGVLGSKGTPAEYKSSVSPVIDDALVKVMASGLGVSPAQLLIRYQIECGHNVVVKSSSAAHLWDNLQALTFTLDGSQVDALHALNRNKRIFTFAGMGDTHKNYPFLAPY